MVIFYKRHQIIYISLFTSILSASYNNLNYPILNELLETNNKEVYETERHSTNTGEPVAYLQEQAYERGSVHFYTNPETGEYVNSEMIMPRDDEWNIGTNSSINITDENKDCGIEKWATSIIQYNSSFITNEPQPCNAIPSYSGNEEPPGLLNYHVEIIDEKSQIIPEWTNITLDNFELNLLQEQPDEASIYLYSNPMFLYKFLYFSSSSFTADSIRVRFGSGFLNFLFINQLISVLATLLSGNLKLTKSERSELVEIIFGHIDFSLEMKFDNNQIVSIVTALLMSDVPHCFEQVFLTWKMWTIFTTEEQNKMLEVIVCNNYSEHEVKEKYREETLVMLYLFVLNKDTDNSSMCESFKNGITKIYGGAEGSDYNKVSTPLEYVEWYLFSVGEFNTVLLNLPNVFKSLNDFDLINLKKLVKIYLATNGKYLHSIHSNRKYKTHICYALTKFTQLNDQNRNEGVFDILNELYFDPESIRHMFNKWSRTLRHDPYLVEKNGMNEFKNAYNAMRQIVQSKWYNSETFLKLHRMIYSTNSHDKLFLVILFILTKEDILREVNGMLERRACVEKIDRKYCRFAYIENIFMSNASLDPTLLKKYGTGFYVEKIINSVHELTNTNGNFHREHYLYQKLLFHPKFELYNNFLMKLYIENLNKLGLFNRKEKRMQIARDLISSKYYNESAIKLKPILMKGENIYCSEFTECLKEEFERYKNEMKLLKSINFHVDVDFS